jgi:hypothetical protein
MYTWVDNVEGFLQVIPIDREYILSRFVPRKYMAISLKTAIINNQKILFFHPTSKYIDYDVLENWLLKNVPKSALRGNYLNKVDAMNFHNVFR